MFYACGTMRTATEDYQGCDLCLTEYGQRRFPERHKFARPLELPYRVRRPDELHVAECVANSMEVQRAD